MIAHRCSIPVRAVFHRCATGLDRVFHELHTRREVVSRATASAGRTPNSRGTNPMQP